MTTQSNDRASPTEDAIKTRIITHMNADHQDSLVRYLEHYSKVPSYTARHAHITDVSLAWMLISTSTTTLASPSKSPTTAASSKPHVAAHQHVIPLDPPLSSYSAFRQRVVDMDKECLAALARSPITVKKYIPPTGYRLVLGAAVIFAFALLSSAANVDPLRSGWLVPKALKSRLSPTFFSWLKTLRLWVLLPTLVAHSAEVCQLTAQSFSESGQGFRAAVHGSFTDPFMTNRQSTWTDPDYESIAFRG